MSAYYENVGALLKCWNTIEMLASYENVVALLKCRHTIVGVLLKCWCFMRVSSPYGNVGALFNEAHKNLHQWYKLTISLLFGLACSPLLLLVALH